MSQMLRLVKLCSQRAASLLTATAALTVQQQFPVQTARLDYYVHDPADFDYYVTKPTIHDLPVLLHKFENGEDVWPWIWAHPNADGPHFVFIGVTSVTIHQIRAIHKANPNNHNILVVASDQSLKEAAVNDPNVYEECQCGLVTDAGMTLLNHEAKILMLDDERVVTFDQLIIS
jgi:hypothetical protein